MLRNILRMTNASSAAEDPPAKPHRTPRRRWRRCLRCRDTFKGQGPGERICEACKETDGWRNAAAASKGFIEW